MYHVSLMTHGVIDCTLHYDVHYAPRIDLLDWLTDCSVFSARRYWNRTMNINRGGGPTTVSTYDVLFCESNYLAWNDISLCNRLGIDGGAIESWSVPPSVSHFLIYVCHKQAMPGLSQSIWTVSDSQSQIPFYIYN